MLSCFLCKFSNGRKIAIRRARNLRNKDRNNKTEYELPQNPHHKIPEINGPKGKEPTRFGDWENNGKISDF